MRTLVCLCAVVMMLLSCRQEDVVVPSTSLPKSLEIKFQLRDAGTDKDLFLTNNNYRINSVSVYGNRIEGIPWQDTIWYQQRADSTILTVSTVIMGTRNQVLSEDHILQLTEEDYDTVTVAYIADGRYQEEFEGVLPDPYTITLNKLWVYYNGELIDERDLVDSEELRERTLLGRIVNVIYKDTK